MSTDDEFWRRPEDRLPGDEIADSEPADAMWSDEPGEAEWLGGEGEPTAWFAEQEELSEPVWTEGGGEPADDEGGPAASGAEGADAEPRVRAPLTRLQRLSGTLAVASVVVVALLFAFWQSSAGARVPTPTGTPTPTSTITPMPIPDEARTKIYSSTTTASNEFRTAALTLAPTMTAKTTNTYAVRVETSANVDADAAAAFAQKTLDDPRGWAGFGNNNFSLVPDVEGAKLLITIASPATTDRLCGAAAKTQGKFSCKVKNEIVINSDRWHFMVPNFNNLDEYRAYMINHFTGEFLGQRLAFCKTKGEPAPAMAQQDQNLDGCLPNAWPKLK